jgi:HD-like signal output (HDOD) protein
MDLSEPGRRRILFVDDETKVLDGLRRMLHPMRKEWDMVFVASAKQALEALALDPFEVLVTDMRMPGTDGAELLDEVVKVYPELVRLVLSGQWDPEMSIRSAKTAHQYLTKPCSAEMLKATLGRIFSMRRNLAGRTLKRLVSGMTTLPSLPSAYERLMRSLDFAQPTIEQLAEVIGGDLAMTAKVLQLANSAFFGISRHVSHPTDATRCLGVDTIKALALTMGVFSQYDGPPAALAALEKLQRHSLDTARIARSIAEAESVGKEMTNDTFLAGLLHDLGRLILLNKDPEVFQSSITLARDENLDSDAVEREIFGASHAEIGSYLLWLWGLPDPVTDAVGLHHHPEEGETNTMSPLVLVHVADALSREMEPDFDPEPPLNDTFLAEAGFAGRLPKWRELARGRSGVETTA